MMNKIIEMVIVMHSGTSVGTSKGVDSDRVELIGGAVVIGRM